MRGGDRFGRPLGTLQAGGEPADVPAVFLPMAAGIGALAGAIGIYLLRRIVPQRPDTIGLYEPLAAFLAALCATSHACVLHG